MSVSDVISVFSTAESEPGGAYIVTRTSRGTTTLGRYTPGPPSSFPIDASIQPSTGRDVKILAEAGITTESRILTTVTALRPRTKDPLSVTDFDSVTIDGEQWECWQVKRVDYIGDIFYRCLVARQSQD